MTGATGTIGSFLIRCLLAANKKFELGLTVLALVRNKKAAKELFLHFINRKDFLLVEGDVTRPIKVSSSINYIFHCASNTSSQSFVDYPVESLDVAVTGTKNVLELAKEKNIESMVYLSSMEVYGELDADRGLTKENDYGYMDILNVRNSYSMGKRMAEMLCFSYSQEKNIPVKMARLAQTVGANMSYHDSRVCAMMARSVVEKTNIVLNTPGTVIRSFIYITDAISALILILINGTNGESYNVSNKNVIMSIKDMAESISKKFPYTNLEISLQENKIYPKGTNWELDSGKLESLHWCPFVNFDEMFSLLISSFYYQTFTSKNKKNIFILLKKIIKKIFSIKNENIYKVIYIFGIKIKIKYYKLHNLLYKNIISKNKIVFNNFYGMGYGCNPKYIANEIIKRKLPYELIWLCKNIKKERDNFPKEIKLVDYSRKNIIKEMTTTKIYISNVRSTDFIKLGIEKQEGQYYIQTWHGSLGIKKLDSQVSSFSKNYQWIENAKKDSSYIDVIIGNSTFDEKVFHSSFWYDGKVENFGHPRNDIFFISDEDHQFINNKVHNYFSISIEENIILYAPSFRDDGRIDIFSICPEKVISAFEKKFGGSWIFAVRMHPRFKKLSKKLFNFENKRIIDATNYPDMYELMASCKTLITDYSSCIYEFMLSKKPGFIFALDCDIYNNLRGFYFPISSTPFPIATSNSELINNIISFDYDKYKKDVDSFLFNKGCIEDGHASERVVDMIENIMEKNYE